MHHEHQQTHHRHELGKTVLPIQAWALAVGAIIGWGCFILPGTRFLPVSGPLASLIGLAVECQHVVHPPFRHEAGGFLPRAEWGRTKL